MFLTTGPLHPESPLFVGREEELDRIEQWLARADCVGAVSGSRQTGKTSLLLQSRHRMQSRYRFVFVDLEGIFDATEESCYSFLCREITEQLGEQIEAPEDLCPACDSAAFLAFLRQLSRKVAAVRIAIILDEIGALQRGTSIALAHTIRAALSSRHVHVEYARFVFVLSGSSDMRRLTTDKVSPLRNVIDSIYVPDLSPEEADQLLVRGFSGYGLDMPPDVRNRIYHWTAGHPYFTQLIGQQLAEGWSTGDPPPGEAAVDELISCLVEREDKNLPHIHRMLDVSPRSRFLWTSLAQILDGKTVPFSRSDEDAADLELIGAIRARDGECAIRNRIYEKALRTWLEASSAGSGGARTFWERLTGRCRAVSARLSQAQRLVLVVILITLVVNILTSWIKAPAWLLPIDWPFWVVLGVAIVVFVIVSIMQARAFEPQGGNSTVHPTEETGMGEESSEQGSRVSY